MPATALLYGDPSPSLRWRAAIELEGAPADDDEVSAWRAQIDSSVEVHVLLAKLASARYPMATGYLLCQLAHLGYHGPELADAVERIFSFQQADGSWPVWLDGDDEQEPAPASRRSRPANAKPPVPRDEGPRFVTMMTVVPLRGIAAAGFATDDRAERAYEWLLDVRHTDGSWPAGPKADLGLGGRPSLPEPEYRRLTRGTGCRSATTGAVACFALHPRRRRSDAARTGVDHLLARETRDEADVGFEVSRLVGLERALGRVTFYVTFDPAFVLDLASRCGVSANDRRVHELVRFLQGLRGPYGLWEHQAHPQLARWLTFDLECSLRRLVDGDWIGNEESASFTPYKRTERRRY